MAAGPNDRPDLPGAPDRGGGRGELAEATAETLASAPTIASAAVAGAGAPPSARDSRPMLGGFARGESIGRFIVLEPLGAGGMGVVLSAYDPQLDRKVAIKIVRPELAAAADGIGEVKSRLLREAQAMARLSHPNVITVFDVGAVGDDIFVAMELVDGGTLAAWLHREPRPWREALGMLVRAGRGLAAAHHAGLVHRDFKPENVLVGTDGRVRVTDFGLVGTTGAAGELATATLPASAASDRSASALSEQLTRTGAFMGTPAYMAPEQFDGEPLDARADQFSFCVALYEALCGRRPFEGPTSLELTRSAGRIVPFPRNLRIPGRIRSAVVRGLAVDPAGRFPSMDELLAVLERDTWQRTRRLRYGLGLVAAVAVAMWSRTSSGPPPCQTARARLDGVWDEGVKANILGAFAAAAGDRAVASHQRVVAALDGYAGRWVAGHEDACEATAIRHEQSAQLLDLRMQCLERRRSELGALTTLFGGADLEIAIEAPQAAYALVPPEECADREVLSASYPPPPRELGARVSELHRRLAEATARQAAGKWRDGLTLVKPVLAEAREIDYPPLLAESLFVQGTLQRDLRDGRASAATLLEVTLAAARARDDMLLARTWAELVYVVGSLEGRTADGLAFERPARSMLERAGGADPRLRARLENTVGAALRKQGETEAARTHQERALAIQERALGPDHPDAATSLNNLAVIAQAEGKYEDSIRLCDRAAAIQEKAFGPDHPSLARTLSNKAIALHALDRPKEALELSAHVLASLERVLGPDARQVAVPLINMAFIHVGLDEHEEAIALYQRALSITEKLGGPDDPFTARTRGGLGGALVGAGRCADALPHLQGAIAILEKTGADKPEIAYALRSWAVCDQRAGRIGDARARMDRAVAIGEAIAEDASSLADLLDARGELALADERPEDARRDFERGLRIREKLQGAGAYFVARPLEGLGAALLELRRPAQAMVLLERALALELEGGSPRRLAGCEFLLARALWDGDRASRVRARELAERARAGFAKLRQQTDLAAVETWLATHRATRR